MQQRGGGTKPGSSFGLPAGDRAWAFRSFYTRAGRRMSIVDDIVFCHSEVPERTGPHAVGTARLKVQTATHVGKVRTITIQLWYPAERESKLPVLSWLTKLRHPTWAPAHHGAPLYLGTTKFPFITYVPDSGSHHDDNTFTLANLASHGFVLAAIVDPFRNAARHMVTRSTPPDADLAAAALYEHRLLCGVQTATALLDALQALDPGGPGGAWAERLDLRQVGILGYAFGGAVAAATTLTDRRYVVAANLAGVISSKDRIVTAPYLLMLSDFSVPSTGSSGEKAPDATPQAPSQLGEYRRAQWQAEQPESHVIEVAGTKHEHFSDRLIFPSQFVLGRQRLENYKRIRAIIDSYTVAFFGTYLQRAEAHPLMCVRHSPYAEVRFVSHSAEQMELMHQEPAGRG